MAKPRAATIDSAAVAQLELRTPSALAAFFWAGDDVELEPGDVPDDVAGTVPLEPGATAFVLLHRPLLAFAYIHVTKLRSTKLHAN
jgi:hypothetical protein